MHLNQFETPLFEAMKKYAEDQVVPFHVPGHKQGRGLREFREYYGEHVLQTDVNGMDGLDYYNNPTGVIQAAEALLSEAYGAAHAFFLVNGTTSGVHVMILSACAPGDAIILPRNAHKSTVSGLILSGAIPVYVQPEFHPELGIAMGVSTQTMNQAILSHSEAKAAFVINPTYYGMTSDIVTLTKSAHDTGMLMLADEAHGAHLAFHPGFPVSAMAAGADMSAVSVHKTGGSMTQSSALLLGSGACVEKARQALNLISTSSTSYILLCSLDVARKQLAVNGRALLEETLQLAQWARAEINQIDGLYAFGKELGTLPGCFDMDETKLGIHVGRLGYTGYEMEYILRRDYNIQIEMSDMCNILAVVTLGDQKQNLQRLIDALKDIARRTAVRTRCSCIMKPASPEVVVPPREAYFSAKRSMALESSVGEISGEMIMAYPPGIPVLGIGERITREVVDYIGLMRSEKCQLQGGADPRVECIRVIKQESNR